MDDLYALTLALGRLLWCTAPWLVLWDVAVLGALWAAVRAV